MDNMTTTISQLKEFEGKEVSLNGWVYNTRSIGKIWFLILRDAKCLSLIHISEKTRRRGISYAVL